MKLVTANSTDIFDDYVQAYSGKVVGHLAQGKVVDAMAIVKGWDWVLIGKDGIGYVPLSILCPIKYCKAQ